MTTFGLKILVVVILFVSNSVFAEKVMQESDPTKTVVDHKHVGEESVFSRLGRWFEDGVNGFFSEDKKSENNGSSGKDKYLETPQSVNELKKQTQTTAKDGAKQNPYQAIASVINEKGSASCAEKGENLAGFIGADEPNASAVIYFDEKAPNQEMISAVVASEELSGPYLAVIDVAQGNNCEATYEVLKIWLEACPQVVSAVYGNYQFKTRLSPSVMLFEATENLHLYTMPLPGNGGCLTLQKELI